MSITIPTLPRRLVARLRSRLAAALGDFLSRPAVDSMRAATTNATSLSAVLRNGDVLLTEGNTRAAALVKGKTGHLSLYKLAEGVRFELTRDLHPCRFSRPVP
jgi:hypothetical protein